MGNVISARTVVVGDENHQPPGAHCIIVHFPSLNKLLQRTPNGWGFAEGNQYSTTLKFRKVCRLDTKLRNYYDTAQLSCVFHLNLEEVGIGNIQTVNFTRLGQGKCAGLVL